jgi:hypothetical protein
MKKLTEKEFFEAPRKIQFIYMTEFVGMNFFEEAMREHPEYFPEEIEKKKKWDAIPQEVHDKYWEEMRELDKKLMKDVPPSKGVLYFAINPKEFDEWHEKRDAARKKGWRERKAIHDKFYSQYGIEWTGREL